MFAVDAGSTQGVGQTVAKYGLRKKGVKAGGYDLMPTTLKLISTNQLDFTIDQQPYLQGWLPVIQLFFYKYSSGLVAPSNTNTGLLFVTKDEREAVHLDEDTLRGQQQRPEVPRLVIRGARPRQQHGLRNPRNASASAGALRVRSCDAARPASSSCCSG